MYLYLWAAFLHKQIKQLLYKERISCVFCLQIQDQASQEDKMNILVQLFWICIAILESDYEHEFLLGLRLLDKVPELMGFLDPVSYEKTCMISTKNSP